MAIKMCFPQIQKISFINWFTPVWWFECDVLHDFKHLTIWSLGCGAVWGILGYVVYAEDACY